MAMHIPGRLFCVAALVVLALVGSVKEAAASVAKFRVTDVKLQGEKATVTIAWEYNSGSSSTYTGKGVKLYLHNASPGYGSAAKGTPMGQVDMTNGTGTHKFEIDIKA